MHEWRVQQGKESLLRKMHFGTYGGMIKSAKRSPRAPTKYARVQVQYPSAFELNSRDNVYIFFCSQDTPRNIVIYCISVWNARIIRKLIKWNIIVAWRPWNQMVELGSVDVTHCHPHHSIKFSFDLILVFISINVMPHTCHADRLKSFVCIWRLCMYISFIHLEIYQATIYNWRH